MSTVLAPGGDGANETDPPHPPLQQWRTVSANPNQCAPKGLQQPDIA